MRKISIAIPFFLALFAHLYGSIFFPSLRLLAFAPFLAIVFQRFLLLRSLWIAALVGLIADFTSFASRLGFFSLIYTLVAWIAHRQRSLFFEDKPLAFFFYTAFISCVISAIELTLLFSSNNRIFFDLHSLLSDLLLMPLVDGLYAFFWFTCPLQVYTLFRKKWKKF